MPSIYCEEYVFIQAIHIVTSLASVSKFTVFRTGVHGVRVQPNGLSNAWAALHRNGKDLYPGIPPHTVCDVYCYLRCAPTDSIYTNL